MQIFWGSVYLTVCCIIHVSILAACVEALQRLFPRDGRPRKLLGMINLMLVSLGFIIFSHTVQVWLWARVLIGNDQLQDWNSAVYFSLVSYTSLGYGDIVLDPGFRVYGAFSSVTGLLAFGLSTAFLVALMSRLLRSRPD